MNKQHKIKNEALQWGPLGSYTRSFHCIVVGAICVLIGVRGGHLCILEEYVRIHSRFTSKLRPPKYPCNKGHAIFRTPCYNWGPYKLIMLKKV